MDQKYDECLFYMWQHLSKESQVWVIPHMDCQDTIEFCVLLVCMRCILRPTPHIDVFREA